MSDPETPPEQTIASTADVPVEHDAVLDAAIELLNEADGADDVDPGSDEPHRTGPPDEEAEKPSETPTQESEAATEEKPAETDPKPEDEPATDEPADEIPDFDSLAEIALKRKSERQARQPAPPPQPPGQTPNTDPAVVAAKEAMLAQQMEKLELFNRDPLAYAQKYTDDPAAWYQKFTRLGIDPDGTRAADEVKTVRQENEDMRKEQGAWREEQARAAAQKAQAENDRREQETFLGLLGEEDFPLWNALGGRERKLQFAYEVSDLLSQSTDGFDLTTIARVGEKELRKRAERMSKALTELSGGSKAPGKTENGSNGATRGKPNNGAASVTIDNATASATASDRSGPRTEDEVLDDAVRYLNTME